eukprot:sb/3464356/
MAWASNQLPGPFWEQGSVSQDYSRIKIPVLVFGGLDDGYTSAAEALTRNLNSESKVIIGPWCHEWPDTSPSGTQIDYTDVCLKWFTEHLKDVPRDYTAGGGVDSWPRLVVSVRDSFHPDQVCPGDGECQEPIKCEFLKFPNWPDECVKDKVWYCGDDGQLTTNPTESKEKIKVLTHGDQGKWSGIWCPFGGKYDFPGDQREAFKFSTVFKTPPLSSLLTIVGRGSVRVTLAEPHPKGRVYLCVKIGDIPEGDREGAITLVTRSHYDLASLVPTVNDGLVSYTLPLHMTGHRFTPGRSVAMALALSGFPLVWPSFGDPVILLESCSLSLPCVEDGAVEVVKFNPPRPLLKLPSKESGFYYLGPCYEMFGNRTIYEHATPVNHIFHTIGLRFKERTREIYVPFEDQNMCSATVKKQYSVEFDSIPGYVRIETDQRMEGGLGMMSNLMRNMVMIGSGFLFRMRMRYCCPSPGTTRS